MSCLHKSKGVFNLLFVFYNDKVTDTRKTAPSVNAHLGIVLQELATYQKYSKVC
jgi:hypothetical protein